MSSPPPVLVRWLAALLATVVGAVGWLLGWGWAGVALVAVGCAVLVLDGRGRAGTTARASAAGAIALLVAVGWGQLEATRDPAAVRAAREREAVRRLADELTAAVQVLERLVDGATGQATGDRRRAFGRLEQLLPAGIPAAAVAVMEPTGAPWAWAGRLRLLPADSGPPLGVRFVPHAAVLEVRRPAGTRTAVASLLLWADPAAVDRAATWVHRFETRHGVEVSFRSAAAGTAGAGLVTLRAAGGAAAELVAEVRAVVPADGDAGLTPRRVVSLLVTVLLVAGVVGAPGTAAQLGVLAAGLVVGVFSPVGAALGLGTLFSPATYFRPVLGPFSASAGALILTGGLLTIAGVWLWRARVGRGWPTVSAGVLLLLLAPYVVSSLGRGITPPAGGVRIPLWLSWQLAVVLAVAAVLVVAAALFRGQRSVSGPAWRVALAVAIAAGAAIVGLYTWQPVGGWPEWYTFLWTPALILVVLPAPRRATVLGIALVAGSAAALVTWGTAIEGRMEVARRDVSRLGGEADPLVLPLLERFGARLAARQSPLEASDLYAAWADSGLGLQSYPAQLAVRRDDGSARVEVPLDSLDVPDSAVARLVRELPRGPTRQVRAVTRTPGVHYVLAVRVAPDTVATVVVGPRTRLIPPLRLGRLLRPAAAALPLYEVALEAPAPSREAADGEFRWQRAGWELRGQRTVQLPEGPRRVRAVLELGDLGPLLVRGVLVVLLDAVVLALLWLLAEGLAGERPRWPDPRRASRSFRLRLAVALGAFFVAPAVGFAAWGFYRIGGEVREARDLLILQALRDVALGAGGLVDAPTEALGDGLRGLAVRIDAELGLYSGPVLVAASDPVIADLGVVTPVVDPHAFVALALDRGIELTHDADFVQRTERVGYRVARPGPPGGVGILAAPRIADRADLRAGQLDLALVLLLATLLGIGAAAMAAQVASLALSRPVADLRAAALALARGDAPPAPSRRPAAEFEPVFGAFDRMVEDVRASQEALDAAQRRTAAVLSTVATGVVALDPSGRVLLANPKAVELLGAPLPLGAPFTAALDPAWHPALAHALEAPLPAADGVASRDLDVGGRRFTLRMTPLGAAGGGAVLALDDVTGIAEAERVLAWGEMARQVAHEIKNPLTPLRLGVQHLRRLRGDRAGDFDQVLQETTTRILGEIDRLDAIARAFSRFGAPATAAAPLERLDLHAAAADVVALYGLGGPGDGARIRLAGEGPVWVAARGDELREVLLNLVENARAAGATEIDLLAAPGLLRVADNGRGIDPAQLPRIFEPRFSTTTRGAGLGLAIVRRLVEGWGAAVAAESEPGRGTRVTVRWPG